MPLYKNKICKTLHQHNKGTIPGEDMKKLQEIAADYCTVKNYVYGRYGKIASLPKLYPGYTVQNEMTKCGLREELGLPSVYFYLAVFDALKDIKTHWSHVKAKINVQIGKNEGFTPEERHYLRFVLKTDSAFKAVLNQEPVILKEHMREKYELLAADADVKKLHNYLRRQTRKYLVKLHTDLAEGFAISGKAYRYADHGIYIAVKEKRKRIFIPLTDNNQYKSQLYIKLYPQRQKIEIKVPVHVEVREHLDYSSQVGVAMGMFTMLTTDQGHRYGERLGEYESQYADWMREQTGIYRNNKDANPGRKKYTEKKRRYEEQLHNYINQEINRFLREEKPCVIYMPKLPGHQAGGVNKKINNYATFWQKGYIRNRLMQKCREQSIELKEVRGEGISNECSCCGTEGKKKEEIFTCPFCGYQTEEKTNTARNAKNRGIGLGNRAGIIKTGALDKFL